MAGQAGLELVEANELLNERIVVLEEEASLIVKEDVEDAIV